MIRKSVEVRKVDDGDVRPCSDGEGGGILITLVRHYDYGEHREVIALPTALAADLHRQLGEALS